MFVLFFVFVWLVVFFACLALLLFCSFVLLVCLFVVLFCYVLLLFVLLCWSWLVGSVRLGLVLFFLLFAVCNAQQLSTMNVLLLRTQLLQDDMQTSWKQTSFFIPLSLPNSLFIAAT